MLGAHWDALRVWKALNKHWLLLLLFYFYYYLYVPLGPWALAPWPSSTASAARPVSSHLKHPSCRSWSPGQCSGWWSAWTWGGRRSSTCRSDPLRRLWSGRGVSEEAGGWSRLRYLSVRREDMLILVLPLHRCMLALVYTVLSRVMWKQITGILLGWDSNLRPL